MGYEKIYYIIFNNRNADNICSAFAKDYSDYPQKFWDLTKEHWAYAAISELRIRKIINGFSDGSFRPNSTITRAEWTKIMVTALNIPIAKTGYVEYI